MFRGILDRDFLCRLMQRQFVNEKMFITLSVLAIIMTRVLLIHHSPQYATSPDLVIYQSAGQTVLEGVNPYDFSDSPPVRERLRQEAAKKAGFVGATQEVWNHYVSSNLPVSTLLYAAIQKVSGGSAHIWRLCLVAGDILIFVGLFCLMRVLRGPVVSVGTQLGITFLSVLSPPLLIWGTILPEDKQFQTALMLFSAALLIASIKSGARHGREFFLGVILGLSVMFKMFGVFFFPLWVKVAKNKGIGFVLYTLAGGLLTLVVSFMFFGFMYVRPMLSRASVDAASLPHHASPWIFLSGFGHDNLVVAKYMLCCVLLMMLAYLFTRRRIDALNFCAALAVIYATLWLQNGSMDRINIVITFAIASIYSLSATSFTLFSVLYAVVYGALAMFQKIYNYHIHHASAIYNERMDSFIVIIFLVSYFVILVRPVSLISNSFPGDARRKLRSVQK